MSGDHVYKYFNKNVDPYTSYWAVTLRGTALPVLFTTEVDAKVHLMECQRIDPKMIYEFWKAHRAESTRTMFLVVDDKGGWKLSPLPGLGNYDRELRKRKNVPEQA